MGVNRWTWPVAAIALASCVGTIGSGDDGSNPTGVVDATLIAKSGLRRMTTSEFYNTVKDLLKTTDLPVFELLPADARTPFDNDYDEQIASQGLIDAADFLAERAADELIADPARRDEVVGCVPENATDEACLRAFVTNFGRRAFRRALSEEEVEQFVHGADGDNGALSYAAETGDFYTAVHSIVWSMLQDPQFLYRIEVGTPIEGQPDVMRLTDYEVASRLSYFVWGSMPDDALLDQAEAGELTTVDGRKRAAERMLQDERAQVRISRFHAMWLGYELLPHGGEMGADMRGETNALIERVIFDENRPWSDLFTMNETYVTPFLADHYGLDVPASTGWVPYGDDRAGLFSHGSFLSIGAKFNDTSPVQRGLVIRERLFCHDIADPPPEVDTDNPVQPEDAICKPARFAGHSVAGCATCHQFIDPLGFGLESYDQFGRFRTHEPDNPDTEDDESLCEIDGQGSFEQGDFNGPKELGELALESGLIQDCLSQQLYRFVTGRSLLDLTDKRIITTIADRMNEGEEEFTFSDLVLEVATHESFTHRKLEEVQ